MANKFRLTLTVFFCILIFLFFSGLLPSNQINANSQEQLQEQHINLDENQNSKEKDSIKCKQCNWLQSLFGCEDEIPVTRDDGSQICCRAELYHEGRCNIGTIR